MTDVLIFTACYGGGHWQASQALAKELAQSPAHLSSEIIDFMELISTVLNRLTQYTYVNSMRNTPALYGYLYWKANNARFESFLENCLTNFGLHKILNYIRKQTPQLILATYPMAAGLVSYLKKSQLVQVPLVTIITDMTRHSQWIHPETDLYLVGSNYVKEYLLQHGVPSSKIAVTGIPIDPKFRSVPGRAALFHKLGLQPDLPAVLIMTGAEGMLRDVPAICSRLDRLELPFQVLVIAGRDRKLYNRLNRMQSRFTRPFRVYGFINNVQELMGAASLLITKAGGLTTSEALAVGLPMIIYKPIPGQEAENARYLIQSGAALIAENLDELEGSVWKLLSEKHLLEFKRHKARASGRPDSARIAAHLIGCLLKQGDAAGHQPCDHELTSLQTIK